MVARAQQPKAVRRIGVLTGASGPVSDARLDAFLKALAQLGWIEGQNVRLEIRRGGGDANAIRKHATELAALAPDVIMAVGICRRGDRMKRREFIMLQAEGSAS